MLGGHDSEYVALVWTVASTFGLAVLVTLVALYRRAAVRAEVEHAERVIADHDRSDHSDS
jgi:hypothetical protein